MRGPEALGKLDERLGILHESFEVIERFRQRSLNHLMFLYQNKSEIKSLFNQSRLNMQK